MDAHLVMLERSGIMGLLAAALSACGSSVGADAATPVDVQPSTDLATVPDAAGTKAGSAPDGVGASDGSEGDTAPPPPFMAVAPCLDASDYVAGDSIGIAGFTYTPPCLRVPVGTVVTIQADGVHPLAPRGGGTSGNPIGPQTAAAPVLFREPGFFPFECTEHIDQRMYGVVWVVPR